MDTSIPLIVEEVIKHLPTRHNQKKHGRFGPKSNLYESEEDAKEVALMTGEVVVEDLRGWRTVSRKQAETIAKENEKAEAKFLKAKKERFDNWHPEIEELKEGLRSVNASKSDVPEPLEFATLIAKYASQMWEPEFGHLSTKDVPRSVVTNVRRQLKKIYPSGFVRLYRGVSGGPHKAKGNLVSWSQSRKVAEGFSMTDYGFGEEGGRILTADVPIDKIYASYLTNRSLRLGEHAREKEFLVEDSIAYKETPLVIRSL